MDPGQELSPLAPDSETMTLQAFKQNQLDDLDHHKLGTLNKFESFTLLNKPSINQNQKFTP